MERRRRRWPLARIVPACGRVVYSRGMHVLLVSNQQSGSADAIDPAAALREHDCVVTEVDIADAASWDARRATERAGSVERVVVAGGDGSVGCAARIALTLDVPLAVVPSGTANDFARAMELSDDHAVACELAARGTKLRDIDLADVDGTPFVNVASIGVAPTAAERAQSLKGVLKALAYPVGAAMAAASTRPVSIVAKVDDELVWTGKAWQAMVASTGAFGGWADTGTARHGDGALDLVIVPAGRGTRRLVFDAAALVRGELASRDGVHHARGAKIEVTLHRAPRIVVDGELIDVDDRHVLARVEPRPVRVVVG
jgi:diacylglycerol kinase family enzyme